MDVTENQMGTETVAVHSLQQLTSVGGETGADASTPPPSRIGLATVAMSANDSRQLIECQTRIVKAVFFILLALALVAIQYFGVSA